MKPILASIFVVSACGAEDVDLLAPPQTSQSTSALELDDEEEQGRYLLGRFADRKTGPYHFWVAGTGTIGTTSFTVDVSGGRLTAEHADGSPFSDEDFVGMEFPTGTHPLRIDAVEITAETGDVSYELSYDPGTGWTPYCDPASGTEAIAMKGRWTLTRDHLEGDEISFACKGAAVAAKCVGWGYDPGESGRFVKGSPWQIHQACTQHASADYCNVGVARTRELTPIRIRDWVAGGKDAPHDLLILDPRATWPPPDELYFEGVWSFNKPVVCKTKHRWIQLPPGGYCPALVPDPRHHDGDGRKGEYCEDLDLEQLAMKGALFATSSRVMDIYVHRWEGPSGDLVATVNGYVENGSPVKPPFGRQGYTLAVPGHSYVILRNLPGSLHPVADVVPVYTQHNAITGDRVVAPLDPLGQGVTVDHVVDMSRPEGYLLRSIPPNATNVVPLGLFSNGSDYLTALANPGGWMPHGVIGYVMLP